MRTRIYRKLAEVFISFEKEVEEARFRSSLGRLPPPLLAKIANALRAAEAEIIATSDNGLGSPAPSDIGGDMFLVHRVAELDEVPYVHVPHLAEQMAWISRRFRNSGGWDLLNPSHAPLHQKV